MSDVLTRIKRAVLDGRYRFTNKARTEMAVDSLSELDVLESLVEARAIAKTIRSRSPFRTERREMLHVIEAPNLAGFFVYTKGKLAHDADGREMLYILISAKRSD